MRMEHLPARDETVKDAEFMQTFGGKGANQAVAGGRAGGEVTFVNCVGDDPYAERMLRGFAESRIRTEAIYQERGISSGTALVMIGEGGHNYLSIAPGANYRLTPARLEEVRDRIAAAGYVLLQNEIPTETVDRAIELAAEVDAKVVWNYAPAQQVGDRPFGSVSILIVNEPEATVVTGVTVTDRDSAEEAARSILSRGVATAIVTLGESGSVIATAGSWPSGPGPAVAGLADAVVSHVPAFPVEPVDTTAAGDTYCGALVVALSEDRSLEDAVRFASAAAALSVQKLGAQPSAPWREDIDAFLRQHG